MTINLLPLQNGSDIRGIATAGVDGETVNLTPGAVKRIARAYVCWLQKKTQKNSPLVISVGRDSRISGPDLLQSFISGITESGANAVDCGLASTPAMFMSTVFEHTRFDGAVMLTASHLPFNRNGIKFFTRDGGLDKSDIREILGRAGSDDFAAAKHPGKVSDYKLMKDYSGFLVDTIRRGVNHPDHPDTPLQGFHIVVDAGNGSGGFFADQVLKPLGANTEGSRYLDPDGRFPHHVPNPEDEWAMDAIRSATLSSQADLGIIFDTDVDRAAAVDRYGTAINRNRLIALMAAIVLEEHPGTNIVTDSITSDHLTTFINDHLKGFHHCYKRGYKNVINEARRLNREGLDCWLAIETSGHAALKENHFLDDGAYLITKILITAAKLRMQGRELADLTAQLQVPAESREFRIRIEDPDFIKYGNQVIAELPRFVNTIPGWSVVPDTHEGVRVACNAASGNGWFLLRLSLHDPVIPLNVESDNHGGIRQIMGILEGFLKGYDGLVM